MSDSRITPIGTRSRAAATRRRQRRHILGTATLAALAILATAGFGAAASYKTVTLDVDGVTTPVSGFNAHVQDVLDATGTSLREHDLVAPDAATPLRDGEVIAVRHAHEYVASAGTGTVTLWSTATSIEGLARTITASGAAQSIPTRGDPRSALPLVDADTDITLTADGVRDTVTANPRDTAQTIADKAGVALSPNDRVHARLTSGGLALDITRVTRGTRVETTPLPHDTERYDDPDLAVGEEKVTQAGADGSTLTTIWEETVDGAPTVHVVEDVQTIEPVAERVAVGTKLPDPPVVLSREAIASPPASDAQRIAYDMLTRRGWADQWASLDALVTRESGWSTTAVNPSGAYGIPQAYPGEKMSSYGADWQTNPSTQIAWMLDYIASRYGDPDAAWAHSQSTGWY